VLVVLVVVLVDVVVSAVLVEVATPTLPDVTAEPEGP
tara:strand:+ start:485 stop:595 length:111 start_codon:yes stop_codon:yes gene_type:complete